MPPAQERLQMSLPCKRHMHDRLGNNSRNRGVCKFRRSPDLVKPVELLCPLLWIFAQLPHRIDHVVCVDGKIRSEMEQCWFDLITVDIEYVQIRAEVLNQIVPTFSDKIPIGVEYRIDLSDADFYSYG